jgi:hypothetical protein
MHSLKFFIQYFSLQRANFSFQIGGKEKSSHRKRRIGKPRRDVNPPFYRENLIRRGKRRSIEKGQERGVSASCKGYSYLYIDSSFLSVRERFYGGDRRKMGEETQKRLLPIQVRTASFFPLSGEGRDLF